MGGSIGNRQDRAVLSRAAPRAFRTRGPRGWDCWGDEIGKFDEQAAATNNSITTEIASERFSRRISLKKSLMAMLSTFLTGTAAASGIAWMNSIGNLGGFFGPTAARGTFALMSAMISAL